MTRLGVAAVLAFAISLAVMAPAIAWAQAPIVASDPAVSTDTAGSSTGPSIQISMPDGSDRARTSNGLRILLMLTILSIAPGILISMTSFTRIMLVLSFVRQAMGTQNAPPTQVLLSLALLLTGVVMGPVFTRIHERAVGPYMDEQIDDAEAYTRASGEMRTWMLRQTREDDLLLFYEVSHVDRPAQADDVSLRMLVPAFIISELRTGFEMGFLLFLPFVLVDLICASVLTAMGMMMMPPTMISTPLKILLFVVVDGWSLLVRSLVASFGGPG